MTKKMLAKVKKVKTPEDLEALDIGNPVYEVGERGGGVGLDGDDVAAYCDIPAKYLPNNFGCGCNYLGGGVRGAIFPSGYSENVPETVKPFLDALAQACIRVYENIENGNGMNDDEYADGDTNWDAKATKASRKAGVVSAY